jgi:citrate lyase subunit beta/citryl-CoA lyase
MPVTYLFVPGDRPDRFAKALAAGADAIVLDLEDAVTPSAKSAARRNIRAFIDAGTAPADRVVVRIADAGSPEFRDDLDLLRGGGIRFAMIAKAEDPQTVAAVCSRLPPDGSVLPLIETAQGVARVDAIAGAPRVQRLVFGTLDYTVDLDLSGDERGLIHPSAKIGLASRCAGIASPVAGVTAAIDDDARVLADLAFARAFGFGAKLCIHPRQVSVIADAMRPTAAELEWARKVLAAASGTAGAVQVDGRMVDRPVVLKAQTLLSRASPAAMPTSKTDP